MTEVPTPDDFRYSRTIEVRFRDLDGMDHVNNAVFFTYFEQGRVGYWRALGMDPPPGAAGDSVQVWYDYDAERTVPIPQSVRATLEGFDGSAMSS